MEEEAESRKRKEHDDGGGEVAKAVQIAFAMLDTEEEEEDVVELEEAAVAEVMRWLEEEADSSAALSHSQTSLSYRQETAFVTINGNEESCGPSFSSSASTVMASVDTSGGVRGVPYFVGCPSDLAAWPSAAPLVWAPAGRMAAEGCGAAAGEAPEGEVEWVARALGAGGAAIKVEESRM